MKRATSAAAAMFIFAVLASAAPDSTERHTLSFSGEPIEAALAVFAEQAGLTLDVGPHGVPDGGQPVWLYVEDASAVDAARLLSIASDLQVSADGERLIVRADDAPRAERVTRGYDVSVAAGRFVQYVNSFGESEDNGGRADRPRRTAAERLCRLIETLAWECWHEALEGSVVGDRILFTADAQVHGRIRELLGLLISDQGGESSELKPERAARARLKECQVNVSLENTPLGSVIALLCREAGTGFVIDAQVAVLASEVHIDCTAEDSAARLLQGLLEECGATMSFALGVFQVRERDWRGMSGYRVFEVSELLKRASNAYDRQRTVPGREEGFEGSLREAGGVHVVVRALSRELEAQGVDAGIQAYGTRLFVGGGIAATDAAAKVLKEMGWEEARADD